MTYEPHKMDERAALTSSKTVAAMLKQGATCGRLVEKLARLLACTPDGVLARLTHVLADAAAAQAQLTQVRQALADRDPWEEVHTVSKFGERRCWFCHATKTMGSWDDPAEKGHDAGCLWLQHKVSQ